MTHKTLIFIVCALTLTVTARVGTAKGLQFVEIVLVEHATGQPLSEGSAGVGNTIAISQEGRIRIPVRPNQPRSITVIHPGFSARDIELPPDPGKVVVRMQPCSIDPFHLLDGTAKELRQREIEPRRYIRGPSGFIDTPVLTIGDALLFG